MTAEIKALRAKFPYIPAYCACMGSYQYWVEDQLRQAEALNAPASPCNKGEAFPVQRVSFINLLTINFYTMKKVFLITAIAVVLFGQATTASADGHRGRPKSDKPAKEHKARKHGKNWKGGTFE